jgi:hypothetical protein
MGWALPFLFMQLFVKGRSATEFVDVTQESFLVFSIVSLTLFSLVVGVALSRSPFMHWKARVMRELRERSLHGFRNRARIT